MKTFKGDWKDILLEVKRDIAQKMVDKVKNYIRVNNISASGFLYNNIKVVREGKDFKMSAPIYLKYALEGTPPRTKNINSLRQDILVWLEKKGIFPVSRSLAFLIANKIHSRGSYKFRNPQRGIKLRDLTEDSIDYKDIRIKLFENINSNL